MVVRIGVEAAGHYPRTLVALLQAAGLEVVELNRERSKTHGANSFYER